MGTQISQNDAPDWFKAKKQSKIEFCPTNTADEESENEAFEEILKDCGKDIFHLHRSLRVLKFVRAMRLIDSKWRKQSKVKLGPTNTTDEESENEAFGEILEDFGKDIFHLHPIMRVLKFHRTKRLID